MSPELPSVVLDLPQIPDAVLSVVTEPSPLSECLEHELPPSVRLSPTPEPVEEPLSTLPVLKEGSIEVDEERLLERPATPLNFGLRDPTYTQDKQQSIESIKAKQAESSKVFEKMFESIPGLKTTRSIP